MHIDRKALAKAVKEKRGEASLREAEEASGLSRSTLSNIENENARDFPLSTTVKLEKWLGQPLTAFLIPEEVGA